MSLSPVGLVCCEPDNHEKLREADEDKAAAAGGGEAAAATRKAAVSEKAAAAMHRGSREPAGAEDREGAGWE